MLHNLLVIKIVFTEISIH